MFDFFFGWRKASKCKKLLKRVRCKLYLLKNKRLSIVRLLRDDIAQLIKIGYQDIAFNRAGQLFEDENMMALYELLDNFCEFLLKHMSYIRRNKDCPNVVNEAVSSLIFASVRFGDLPELRVIRKLFGERYGKGFETTALELLPGNLVNFQVKERMSVQSVPDNVKHSLVDDITKDCCLEEEILALEYIPQQQQQEIESNELGASYSNVKADSCRTEEFEIQVSTANDTEGKPIYIDLASTGRSHTFQSQPRQSYDAISTSVSPSAGQFSSPDILDSPTRVKEAEDIHVGMGSEDSSLISPRTKEFPMVTASSSESSPRFSDEVIVYLDDVEEVLSSITKVGSFPDQRIFKFKSWILSKTEKIEKNSDAKYLDESESWSEITWLSSHSKQMKPSSRRLKRRSESLESPAFKDIDSETYYNKPWKKTPAHKQFHDTRRKQSRLSQEFEHSCLKYPCHTYGRGDEEAIHSHQLKHQCKNFPNCHSSRTEELDTEMEWYTFTQQPRRINCELGRKSRYFPEKQNKKMEAKVLEVLEVRATTMPRERSKESDVDNVLRSRSFPLQSPTHVHPNLPDYDDIAAKFRALKQQHLRSKCNLEL